MNINRIADANAQNTSALQKSPDAEEGARSKSTLASDNTDKFVKSDLSYSPAYTKHLSSSEKGSLQIGNEGIYADSTRKISQFKQLISAMLAMQNDESHQVEILDIPSEEFLDTISGGSLVEDAADGDNPWSSKNVAKRIIEFAKAVSGGDKSKIAELKEAFIKGFEEAEKVYGGKGKLADVSYETYDEVMRMFDEWEENN